MCGDYLLHWSAGLNRLACKSDVDILLEKMFYSSKGEKISLDQESTLVSIPQSIRSSSIKSFQFSLSHGLPEMHV